jgi:putative hemolysin
MTGKIILFFVLLVFSALFSSSETALFSVRRKILEGIAKEGNPAARRVLALLDKPRRLLITILSANIFVNISLAVLAVSIAYDIAMTHQWPLLWSVLFEVLAVTLLILIFGEILPKIIAVRNPVRYSMAISGFISMLNYLLTPSTEFFYRAINGLARLFRVEKESLFNRTEDLYALVELGEKRGMLQSKEKDMITSLMKFSDTSIREIMVPRPDIIAIDIHQKPQEIIQFVEAQRFSRFPVYQNDLDTIIGFLFTKDLLPYIDQEVPDFNTRNLLRPPLFVPETKSISNMLKEFQERKTKIAVVVDEYGGTSGIVTVEDVLEEILGDIQDEMDDDEQPEFVWNAPNELCVEAGINVEDLAELLKTDFPEEREYDTLGGFIMDELGHVPKPREKVSWKGFEFIVQKMDKRRLVSILIKLPDRSANEA